MSRELRVVPAAPSESGTVLAALRDALSGGPAVLPVPAPGGIAGAESTASREDLPPTVEQRIALVVETSGSTGRPKRVALTADALLANAAASESALGGPGQWVLALPTHYIAGINVLARSLAAGVDPVVVGGERFTPEGFVDAARRMEVPERFTALVPAQLQTLLEHGGARETLRGFRCVLVGGQATPGALLDRAREAGIPVARSYGASETSGGCVYDGVPIGGTEVRVVDGEVQVGGPSIAEGYLGDPALTAERFVDEGGVRWYRTADAGEWNGERLSVTGRRDDVIISGGVKVALPAVERTLRELPGLTDAVVVAVDDPRWGQVPIAFTAGPGMVETDEAAREAVGHELGAAARPAAIVRLGALPELASGKVDRRALRAMADERRSGTP